MKRKAPLGIDVNILDILNLEAKHNLVIKEINFEQDLMHVINSSSPENLGAFEANLKRHVANNYPTMLDIIEKNFNNPTGGSNYSGHQENFPIYNADQLDDYVPQEKYVRGAPGPEEYITEAKFEKPITVDSRVERGTKKQGYSEDYDRGVSKETRRKGKDRNEVRKKYSRKEEFAKEVSQKIGKKKNLIEGESFDNEKITLLRKENVSLQQAVDELESERARLQEKLKSQAQHTQIKTRRTANDMTFLKDFDLKNFANPSNMDLLRILNEKEMALSRLEKSFQVLEQSYHELLTDEQDTSVRNINFGFENNSYNSNLSKSFYQMNLVDMRNSEFKKKSLNEKKGDSFVGEIKADITRVLNKRRDMILE